MSTPNKSSIGHIAALVAILIWGTTFISTKDEPLTPILITGAVLTLIGLWLSETKLFERGKKHG